MTTSILATGCFRSPQVDFETAKFTEVSATPTPIPASLAPTRADSITIAAVGDIMLGSPYPNDTRMPPNDGADILAEVTPILSAADIAFGNMEAPITDSGESAKCKTPIPAKTPKPLEPGEKPPPIRCFAFRMPTRYAKYLQAAGFDILSLANNHSLDFGLKGIAETRRTLDAIGIAHAGSDRLKHSTAFLEEKGKTVAFVAFAHNTVVPNVNDLVAARRFVSEADKRADIVVVSFTAGPRASQISVCRGKRNCTLEKNAGTCRFLPERSSTPEPTSCSATALTSCGAWKFTRAG